jgi:hypothetical protein
MLLVLLLSFAGFERFWNRHSAFRNGSGVCSGGVHLEAPLLVDLEAHIQ